MFTQSNYLDSSQNVFESTLNLDRLDGENLSLHIAISQPFASPSSSYLTWASGMMSSTTTYTMAPAANASAYGNRGSASTTATAPSNPATGSTIPLSWPYLGEGDKGKGLTNCTHTHTHTLAHTVEWSRRGRAYWSRTPVRMSGIDAGTRGLRAKHNTLLVGAYQKAPHVDIPAPRRGKLTANPSGKFWMPIPMARFLRDEKKWNITNLFSFMFHSCSLFFTVTYTAVGYLVIPRFLITLITAG